MYAIDLHHLNSENTEPLTTIDVEYMITNHLHTFIDFFQEALANELIINEVWVNQLSFVVKSTITNQTIYYSDTLEKAELFKSEMAKRSPVVQEVGRDPVNIVITEVSTIPGDTIPVIDDQGLWLGMYSKDMDLVSNRESWDSRISEAKNTL
jgi:nicotinamide mononucleotide adenylyltransferase